MILTDNETKVDLLNNEAIAKTIIELLKERPDRPVTVGVHGDWGAGKSSVLEMIEAGFSEDKDVLCLKFNGWRFQGFEDAKIALIEGIVTGLIDARPTLTRAAIAVKDIFHRIDWIKATKKTGGLALTAFTGIPTPDQIADLMRVLDGWVADPGQLVTGENIKTAVDGAKSILKPAESKNIPEEIEGFRKAFDQLLQDAGVAQLIVLVDDLDRCLPDTAIETLEAIRLFVFTSKTAFVIAADEAMIEYSVRKHFPELPETTGPRDYARNYLEKLIQVPFRIPALGEAETRIYISLLLIGNEFQDGDPKYLKLITAARERLKRPWTNGGLDAAAVKEAVGDRPEALRALALSEQISPILASGSHGNPRQIKRFLNTLVLREKTAKARGFGDDIQIPVLAKLMLAERFIPKLFEKIAQDASISDQGKCNDLVTLERFLQPEESLPENSKQATSLKAGEEATSGKAGASAKQEDAEEPVTSDSPVLAEWKLNERIVAWAKQSPGLKEIDLRPYLFVTKDRKDYFGPISTLGHLVDVVDRLFEGKLTVQALEPQLKQLQEAEAVKVFDGVRARILTTDKFDLKPPGIDGLQVLVKAQPKLQAQLVDLLGSIPSDRCGPWILTGWTAVLNDHVQASRFQALYEQWSQPSASQTLRVAASKLRKS